MKLKTLFFILVTCFTANTLLGQVPNWTVDENFYEYSMTFVAKININGEPLTSSSDIVGAFVGGVCRGVTHPTFITSSNAYFAYLTVFSNNVGETITFKVYRADTDEVIEIQTSILFEPNQHVGSRFQSYSIADPPLRTGADLISFGFDNQIPDAVEYNDDSIVIFLPDDVDRSALTPVFTMSDGARAFINQVEQTSNLGSRDFTQTVTYQILSEDESILNEIDIIVSNNYVPDDDDDGDEGSTGGSGGTGGGSNGGNDNNPQEPVIQNYQISQSNANCIVNESGSQDSFVILILGLPENQVVFNITSSDPEEVTVLNPEITFTQEAGIFAQFVTLQGVDDEINDGNQTAEITVRVDPTRSDQAYALMPNQTFTCTNIDNDNIPGLIVDQTNGNTLVDESGSSDTVYLSLQTAPSSDVVVDLSIEDATEISVNPTRYRFTNENWFIPQVITIVGVDDELNDGSQKSDLTFEVNSSLSDISYRDISGQNIEITTTDNDALGDPNGNDNGQDSADNNNTPGLIIEQTDENTVVDESGSSDTVYLSLQTQPTTDVVVDLSLEDTTEVYVDPTRYRFTNENWSIAQLITITGVDDELNDGDQRSDLNFNVNSSLSDIDYQNISVQRIEITTTDDEVLGDTNGNDNDQNTDEEDPTDSNDEETDPTDDEEQITPPIFYKRNAVCYNGGQIKVEYDVDGSQAILNLNGQRLKIGQIDQGELIFTDLEIGSYVLEIEGYVKVINIRIDE